MLHKHLACVRNGRERTQSTQKSGDLGFDQQLATEFSTMCGTPNFAGVHNGTGIITQNNPRPI